MRYRGNTGIGDEGVILSARKLLSHAEIAKLPTAYPEILAPTEILDYSSNPTELPIPIFGFVRIRKSETYSGVDSPSHLLVAWGNDWSATAIRSVDWNNGSPAEVNAAALFNSSPDILFFYFNAPFAGDPELSNNSLQDNGLYLVSDSGSGDFSGGGETDTLEVTIHYVIARL